MLFQKKKFQKRTIGELHNYTSYGSAIKPARKWSPAKIFFVILCVALVLLMSKYLISFAQSALGQITKGTVNIVSNSVGDEMKTDASGNINVMIIGYGGTGHAGSFLADSIMVGSFNPKLGAMTMISIPRDLYVYDTGRGIIGRINEVFSVGVGHKREYGSGAELMEGMLEQIMGLKIDYYALIDFNGFEGLIDTIGGITIDVPEGFVDTTYPTINNGYMTVSFTSGVQEMDGKKALQYARSRHSTSDFARSLRQQTIVQAVIHKVMNKGLGNIGKLKKLYNNYVAMVKTNISLNEILGMAKYVYKLDNIFSYGLTTECSNLSYQYSHPGCFLYTPDRSLFGGASIMLPMGGGPGNVGFYDYTKNFVSYVAHNQKYLIENPTIAVMNGIDKQIARQTIGKSEGFANQLGVKLKKYAFNIIDVKNFTQAISGTTLYVLGTGEVSQTIQTLRDFVSITTIEKDPTGLGTLDLTGVDLVLVLGNDYIQSLVNKPFSYYK